MFPDWIIHVLLALFIVADRAAITRLKERVRKLESKGGLPR